MYSSSLHCIAIPIESTVTTLYLYISTADVGEGSLTLSTRSAADINRMIEHRIAKPLPKATSHKALRVSNSLQPLVPDHTSPIHLSFPRSAKFHPPAIPSSRKLPANMSVNQWPPSPNKLQRMGNPNLSDHVLDSTGPNSVIPSNYETPNPATCLPSPVPKLKSLTHPPKTAPKPRSLGHLLQGYPQTNNLPVSDSDKHISARKTPLSTPRNQSNIPFTKGRPPVLDRQNLRHSCKPPGETHSVNHNHKLGKPQSVKPNHKPPSKTAVGESTVDVQVFLQEEPGNDSDAVYQPLIIPHQCPPSSSDPNPQEWTIELLSPQLQFCKPPDEAADGGCTVDVLLQEEPANDNDAVYQPLIAFQGNTSQETTDDSPYLSLVSLQGNKSQDTTDSSYLSLIPLQGNKSQDTTDDSSYLSLIALQGNKSQGTRSEDDCGIKKTDHSGGKVKSTDGGYKSGSAPQEARVRRSNSDLSSQDTDIGKGTIKQSQNTISTQSQPKSGGELIYATPQTYLNSDQYSSSENECGGNPYATFTFAIKDDETNPYSVLHWKMKQVNCTGSQPTLADETNTLEGEEDTVVSSEDEGYDYVRGKWHSGL